MIYRSTPGIRGASRVYEPFVVNDSSEAKNRARFEVQSGPGVSPCMIFTRVQIAFVIYPSHSMRPISARVETITLWVTFVLTRVMGRRLLC